MTRIPTANGSRRVCRHARPGPCGTAEAAATGPSVGARACAAVLGSTLAGGFAANAARYPERTAVVDERGVLTCGSCIAAPTRRPTRPARGVSEGARRSACCVGTTPVSLRRSRHSPSSVPIRSRSTPASRLPSCATSSSASAWSPWCTTRSSDSPRRCRPDMVGFVAWHDGPSDRPTLDELANSGDPGDPPRPHPFRPDDHPDVGNDRHAEGCAARATRRYRARRWRCCRCSRCDPAM